MIEPAFLKRVHADPTLNLKPALHPLPNLNLPLNLPLLSRLVMGIHSSRPLAKLPGDAGSGPVAGEAKQARCLAAIEPMDDVVQPGGGVDVAADGLEDLAVKLGA